MDCCTRFEQANCRLQDRVDELKIENARLRDQVDELRHFFEETEHAVLQTVDAQLNTMKVLKGYRAARLQAI